MAGAVRERKPETTPIRNARSSTRVGAKDFSYRYSCWPESYWFANYRSVVRCSTGTLACAVFAIVVGSVLPDMQFTKPHRQECLCYKRLQTIRVSMSISEVSVRWTGHLLA